MSFWTVAPLNNNTHTHAVAARNPRNVASSLTFTVGHLHFFSTGPFQLTDSLTVELIPCWVCSRGAWLTTSTKRILALRYLPINGWVLFSSGSGPNGSGKETAEILKELLGRLHLTEQKKLENSAVLENICNVQGPTPLAGPETTHRRDRCCLNKQRRQSGPCAVEVGI